jgi:hypothetical protein
MLSDGDVLGAELRLGPGDALARLTGGLAGRDGPLRSSIAPAGSPAGS